MTSATAPTQEPLARFVRLADAAAERARPATAALRRRALDRFRELGFPTVRHEDWQFTALEPLLKPAYEPPSPRPPAVADATVAGPAVVNGRFLPGPASAAPAGSAARCTSLSFALAAGDPAAARFGRLADFSGDAFRALNTAVFDDGALVHVPARSVVEQPIHLTFLTAAERGPVAVHPRNLIVIEDGAQATVIEDHRSAGPETALVNSLSEIVIGANARVEYYVLLRDNKASFHVSNICIRQDRDSGFSLHTALLGGGLVRSNVHPVLAGPGADCLLNGVFLPTGTQHHDNFMKVEHAAPHCSSRQFYKGILDGAGRGVFSGRIIVHKDAQKTDAKQTNNNLLLSADAQIDTMPQLEIYADDVKCTHGATIGRVDDDAVFYLRSRGIPQAEARGLLIYAFAAESLGRMKCEPVRALLAREIAAALPGRLPEGLL
jgi:Fe-S cluster assembly protein SufD